MKTDLKGRFKGKKILVTGGTGTIGSMLVRWLVDDGADVLAVSLDNDERAHAVLPKEASFRRADLRNYDACLDAAGGREYVFHLTAIKGSTQRGNSNVARAYTSFILCNTNMMEAAFRAGVSRYLFVGSIGEYPPVPLRREDEMWNGAPEANDRYMGIAKRAGEIQAEAYSLEYGWDATRIIRLSNVYGPYDDFDPASAHVIPALIHRMTHGENPVHVAGDGSAVRDFIYSEDAVLGALLAIEYAPPCTPINIGSGLGVKIREVAETIADLMPVRPSISWDTGRPTGDSVRVLDVERAKKLLGFHTPTALQDGLKKTIEWYLSNKNLADRRGRELHG